jgi:hypothetical protein
VNLKLEYGSFQDFANRLWPCLCEEGMWVRTDQAASVGEVVEFDVMLTDGFRLFHGSGQVVAVGPGPRAGERGEGLTLRFSQLDQPSRNLIRKVVSKHIGEGGDRFVLAGPATKVEVVGEDEDGEAGAEQPGGSGAEDLVAPFADLDKDSAWSRENEPELTSFLRPSGRARDSVRVGGIAGDDSAIDSNGPASEPLFSTTADSDRAADEVPSVEAWDALPEPPAEASSAWPAPPAGGYAASLFPDLGDDDHRPSLAETQQVQVTAEEFGPRRRLGLDEEPGTFHSTVIPPSSTGSADDQAAAAKGDQPSGDDFPTDHGAAPRGPARWPWVVIGGLVLGAGLYVVLQLDTPISQWLGIEAPAASVSGERTAAAGPTGQSRQKPVPPAEESLQATPQESLEMPDPATDDASSPAAGQTAPDEDAERDSGPIPGEARAPAAPPPAAAARSEPAVEPALAAAADAPEASLSPLRLRRITWRQEGADTVVRLALEGTPTSDRFEIQRVTGDSPRLVLKIDGVEGSVPREPVAIGSADVRQLRFGIHDVDGVRQVHVVADLAAEAVQMIGPVEVDSGGVELRFSQP